MILMAVVAYVQLYCEKQSAPGRKHRQPATAASMAIATRMGKGPAFAHKIRETTKYVIQFQKLPEGHQSKKGGAASLLHNEAMIMGVWRHLAEQKLGKVRNMALPLNINLLNFHNVDNHPRPHALH